MQKKVFAISVLVLAIAGVAYMGFWQKSIGQRADVSIIGPVILADGLGRQAVELALAIQNDFNTEIVSDHVQRRDLPESVLAIIKEHTKKHSRYEDLGPLGKVVIVQGQVWTPSKKSQPPFRKVKQKDQIRIAYSMLESTRIPQEWVSVLNTYYDAVVVPDVFLIEAYRQSGVTIPVFEIPLGLDLHDFLASPLKTQHKTPMVFANLSSAHDRKNQVLLIQAFARALGNNPDAILKINCRGGTKGSMEAIEQEIYRQNCSNIYFSVDSLSKESYLRFFQGVDCYVSLSKGEGFSIQPREAMALGIPVIATDNTGQSTICKSLLVKSVNASLQEPAFYFRTLSRGGDYFNCSLEDAAAAIKEVYLDYASYLSKAQKAREWAAAYDYSNPKVTAMYKNLICPKKIVLGEENSITPEVVVTNSAALYQKYCSLTQDGAFK
ncbi:MAG: glycosyltransferase [Chlamydiae bacterium]|nr:glycosyltransferase [Chlamydiota bacterium]